MFDAESMQGVGEILGLQQPGRLAIDNGDCLWALDQKGGRIICFSAFAPGRQPQIRAAISLPKNCAPTDIGWDWSNNVLLVADDGPSQQVRRYSPQGRELLPFGEPGGIFANSLPPAERGRLMPRRLHAIRGVGADSAGRMVIASDSLGARYECYDKSGGLLWTLHGMEFLDCALPDPADETRVYTKDSVYKMDYRKPDGQQWTLWARTVDARRFPMTPSPFLAGLKRIGGRLYALTCNMMPLPVRVFRFAPETHGETAIPCAEISGDPHGQKGSLWCDRDGDGLEDEGERAELPEAPPEWSVCLDNKGDLWLAGPWQKFWRLPATIDPATGCLGYSYETKIDVALPAPFDGKGRDTCLCRAEYRAETDTMILNGFTTS
ncbi:MAG: hypothetical protein N3A66_06050, partial [Planctomycetota bacterium]|nr:hypothetical protein [Planctomycetota bacterium]